MHSSICFFTSVFGKWGERADSRPATFFALVMPLPALPPQVRDREEGGKDSNAAENPAPKKRKVGTPKKKRDVGGGRGGEGGGSARARHT